MTKISFWPLTVGISLFFILHGSGVKTNWKSSSKKTSLSYVNLLSKPLRFKLHLNIILPSSKQCGWKIFVGMKIWNLGVEAEEGGSISQCLADRIWHAKLHLQCFFLFTEVKLEKSIISLNISPDHFYVLVIYSSCAESLNSKNRIHFCAVDWKRKNVSSVIGTFF